MSFRSTLASLIVLLAMSTPAQAQDAESTAQTAQDTPVNADYRAQPAWMPKADPDKGLVIIFRERRFVGGGVSFKLFHNDSAFPKLKNGSFVYVYLAPGDYQLYSDKKRRNDARLQEIVPGEIYFFEASLVTGMWKSTIDLLPTDAETAKARMAELRKPAPQATQEGTTTPDEPEEAEDTAEDTPAPEAEAGSP